MAENDPKNPSRLAGSPLADDDPFAELARIVGYDKDDKKAEAAQPPASEKPPSHDDAPAPADVVPDHSKLLQTIETPAEPQSDDGVDLEAELLRELEIDVSSPDVSLEPGRPQPSNSPFTTVPQPEPSPVPTEPSRSAEPEREPSWLSPVVPSPDLMKESAVPPASETTPRVSPEPPSEAAQEPLTDPLPELLRTVREYADKPVPQGDFPPIQTAPKPSLDAHVDSGSDYAAGVVSQPTDDTSAFRAQLDEIVHSPQGSSPEANSRSAQTAASDPWPNAAPKADEVPSSLEAELEAAFSALEESGTAPTQAKVESLQEVEDVLPPPETVTESDEIASAYRKFEQDVQAAMPRSESPIEEQLDDVNEMLLAEMAEVEAEAGEAGASPPDIPFDPGSIAESDDVPERIAELEVPDPEPEETAPRVTSDENFGLPLEEELEALASEATASAVDTAEPEAAFPDIHEDDRLRDDRPEILEARADRVSDDIAADDDIVQPPGYRAPEDDGFDLHEEDLSVPEYYPEEEQRHHGRGRGVAAALIVLGVAVAGGAGFYFWNSSISADSANAEPPVITADNDPVKIKPEDPGGTTVPNQDLAVYDRVSGDADAQPQEQSMVTTAEEPVDVVQRTLTPESLPLEGRSVPAEKSEERLVASDTTDGNTPPATSDAGAETAAISPRKVRTLVVKPDGTIVARDLPETPRVVDLSAQNQQPPQTGVDAGQTDGAATTETVVSAVGQATSAAQASAPATTDTASAPAVAETASSDTVAAAGTQPSLPPIEDNLRDTGETPTPVARPLDATQTAANTAESSAVNSAAPVPANRPVGQPVRVAEATPQVTGSVGNQTTSDFNGYSMQISSQPSENGARQSYQDLSSRYASVIGGRDYSIQRANIPDKGVFYRVRIPVGTRAEATALCNQYKAAGGSCFVAR